MTTIAQFQIGQLVATPGALEAINDAGQHIGEFLARHASARDWGDIDPEDRGLNEQALEDGSRIFSVYHTKKGVKLWVITEAEYQPGRRASTCILLPDEY